MKKLKITLSTGRQLTTTQSAEDVDIVIDRFYTQGDLVKLFIQTDSGVKSYISAEHIVMIEVIN